MPPPYRGTATPNGSLTVNKNERPPLAFLPPSVQERTVQVLKKYHYLSHASPSNASYMRLVKQYEALEKLWSSLTCETRLHDLMQLNEKLELQQRGWIAAKWGTSENNRKAKFYSITKAGTKQLAVDAAYWRQLSEGMGRVLAPAEGE